MRRTWTPTTTHLSGFDDNLAAFRRNPSAPPHMTHTVRWMIIADISGLGELRRWLCGTETNTHTHTRTHNYMHENSNNRNKGSNKHHAKSYMATNANLAAEYPRTCSAGWKSPSAANIMQWTDGHSIGTPKPVQYDEPCSLYVRFMREEPGGEENDLQHCCKLSESGFGDTLCFHQNLLDGARSMLQFQRK